MCRAPEVMVVGRRTVWIRTLRRVPRAQAQSLQLAPAAGRGIAVAKLRGISYGAIASKLTCKTQDGSREVRRAKGQAGAHDRTPSTSGVVIVFWAPSCLRSSSFSQAVIVT